MSRHPQHEFLGAGRGEVQVAVAAFVPDAELALCALKFGAAPHI